MLSDEVLNKVVERLVNRIEQGNEYVLDSIGTTIKKIGTLKPSDAHKLVQVFKYGGDYNKIKKQLAKITKLNIKDIEKIFKAVAKSDYEFAEQFYKYRGKKYIPFDENTTLQKQVDAISRLTSEKYMDLARSKALGFSVADNEGNIIYKGLKSTYDSAIDKAVLNVSQGKTTFDSEMYKILKEIGVSGLKTLDFEGRAMRLDSAIRMHLKDALRQLHNDIVMEMAKEYDADGVEISVHINPAPDHEDAQGKQFRINEYEKLQKDGKATTYDDIDIDMHLVLKSGLTSKSFRQISQYNCYHTIFPIVLGVSRQSYSNEELQKIKDDNKKGFEFDGKHYTNYEGTQLQRKIETEIRKQKDLLILGKSSGNEQLMQESQLKINLLTKKYKKLSQASGLPTFNDRLRVSGYKPIKVVEEPIVDRIDKAKNVQSITPMRKGDSIYIPKEQNKKIYDYFIDYYKKDIEEGSFVRNWEKDRYNDLLKIKEAGYKDEIIKLDTIDDCNKLLDKIHFKIEKDKMDDVDFRLLQDATEVLWNNAQKSPAVMKELGGNLGTLTASDRISEVANAWLNTITINKRYFKDYNEFKKICIDNTELHQYLDGKMHSWWVPVAKDYETKVVMTHEYAHIMHKRIAQDIVFKSRGETPAFNYFYTKYGYVDTFLNERRVHSKTREIMRDLIYEPIRRLQKKEGLTQKEIIDKYVSMYGRDNYDDMFAEMFANSQCGKSNALGDELINFLIEIGEWII